MLFVVQCVENGASNVSCSFLVVYSWRVDPIAVSPHCPEPDAPKSVHFSEEIFGLM